MLVRAARADDAEDIARLLTALGYPQGADEVSPRLAAWDAEPASRALVAQVEERVVGVVALHVCPSFERPGSWGRIAALSVDPDRQGAGVGRLLVAAAEREAATLGCTDMEVTSSRHREGAHAFYRRLGYTDLCDRSGRFMRSLAAHHLADILKEQDAEYGAVPREMVDAARAALDKPWGRAGRALDQP